MLAASVSIAAGTSSFLKPEDAGTSSFLKAGKEHSFFKYIMTFILLAAPKVL